MLETAAGIDGRQRPGGWPMSSSEEENERNREIARNEAAREAVSAVRVSSWAIAVAVISGVIVLGIVWAWMNR